TGLGMATLIKTPKGDYFSIPSEGGRSSFAPVNDEEIELWRFVHKRFSHVSFERFISGSGLQLIYEGLHSINRRPIDKLPEPAEIVEAGISNQDWICRQTVEIFCRMFGTVASNLACAVNSCGGLYIGGGI
ncbi:MAG: glucokinase, partial [bacterium]